MSLLRKNVVLLPNTSKQIDPHLTANLIQHLLDVGCIVRSDERSRSFLAHVGTSVTYFADTELFVGADVVFVLGGDGSIIEAARRCVGLDIPIVGINFGRVGYLAELEINELDLVDRILHGEGTVEERMMLDVSVYRDDTVLRAELPALNEVALTNGPLPRLLSFSLFCNGELAEKCYADGMLLVTPTGSTAHSLSAGGPVMDPCLDCIGFTPLCPQTMNRHPVVFRGETVLELRDISVRSADGSIYLTLDGRESFVLRENDVVRVTHSPYRTKLIRIKQGGFLSALRRKLT